MNLAEYVFELESDDFNLDRIVNSVVQWATAPTLTPLILNQ